MILHKILIVSILFIFIPSSLCESDNFETTEEISYHTAEITTAEFTEFTTELDELVTSTIVDLNGNFSFRKCCGGGQILFKDGNNSWTCVNQSSSLEIKIFNKPMDENEVSVWTSNENQSAEEGFPDCKFSSVVNDREIWFRVLDSGLIKIGWHFWVYPIWDRIEGDYCIDSLSQGSQSQENITVDKAQALLFCSLRNYEISKIHTKLHGIVFSISSVSLFLTLIIYYITESVRNMSGWLQINYFVCAFLYVSTEGVRIFLKSDGLNIQSSPWCFYHGIFSQYIATVGSTTALVLGFHMHWAFWKMKPVNTSKKVDFKNILFLIIGPWTLPILGITGRVIYNHYTNPNSSEENGYSKFGYNRCSTSLFRTILFIQIIMLVLNAVFFVATAIAVLKTLYASQFAKKSSKTKLGRDSLEILVKMCIINGLSSGIPAIEFLFGINGNSLALQWVFGRLIFGLQGFWIFLAFGCAKKKRQFITKKFLSFINFNTENKVQMTNPSNNSSNSSSNKTSAL